MNVVCSNHFHFLQEYSYVQSPENPALSDEVEAKRGRIAKEINAYDDADAEAALDALERIGRTYINVSISLTMTKMFQ